MKWIAHHIWDFISRFRNDVYFEDLSTTTETNILVADSDGKVSKRTASGLTTGKVTVTDNNDSSYHPVVFHDGSNNLLDDTGSFQYYPSICNLDLTASAPQLSITSNTNDANDGHITFINNRGGNDGQASDSLGTITWNGMDDGTPSTTQYGSYEVAIGSPVDTDEFGITRILNRTSDGSTSQTQQALTATGHGTNNTVDIGLGYGAASTTTVAGNLTVTSNLTVSGTTTTINTTNLNVEDKNITLNYNAYGDTSGTADGAGITIQDAVDASNDASLTWVAATDKWLSSHPMQITSASGHGQPGLHVNALQTDQNALYISAANTTADILNIDGGALTTASFTKLTNSNSLTNYNNLDGIFGDWDFTKTGNTGDGETYRTIGLNLNITDSASSNHVNSTVDFTGMLLALDSVNTNGGNKNTGLTLQVTDATTNLGIKSSVTDGGAFFKDYSTANPADYSSWTTTTNGATEIATVDGDSHAADLTFNVDGFTKFRSPDNNGGGVEIETGTAAGVAALKIDNNDVDTNALLIEAANTTEHVLDIEAGALTTADVIHVKADALTTGAAINLDINDSLTTSATKSLLKIDYDKSGVTASGQASMTAGLEIDMKDTATNHASGSVINFGAIINLDAASNQGSIQQTGLGIYLADADTANSTGIYSNVEDGGVDFKAVSSANSLDYFTIATGEDGETTFATREDGVGATAHMNFNADGDIVITPGSNKEIKLYTDDNGSPPAAPGISAWIKGESNPYMRLLGEVGGVTNFLLFAQGGGGGVDDYFMIESDASGNATISTADPSGSNGGITLAPDGDLYCRPVSGNTLFTDSTSGKPLVTLKTTNTTKTTSAELKFAKDAANVEDEEVLGQVSFYGDNHGGAQTKHADITAKVNDISAGNYSKGELNFNILNADQGGDRYDTGLKLVGSELNDRHIDVTIAKGEESITTIAGDLDIDGDTVTSAGNLTLDTVGDISLDPHTSKDIFFKEAATERFHFHLDATPTMEVTGNFDIDCSGDIELNADNGTITLKDDSATMVSFTTKGMDGNRRFVAPSSTVGAHTGGDIYYYGDGSTVKGKIYYIDGTNWTLADADAEASTKGLLAVALGTDPDVDGMLLRGFVTLLTEIEGTEAIGSPLYLSATDSGVATITVPASGDFVRVLGYSLHATDNQVYFNPDNTWVQRA